MSIYYTLTIKKTQPSKGQLGWFWVQPDACQVYIFSGEWLPFVGGSGNLTNYVEGFYWKYMFTQENEPAKEIGNIWIKESIKQSYIFLNDWIPFV